MTRKEQMQEALRLYEEDNDRMLANYESYIEMLEKEELEEELIRQELGLFLGY